MEHSNKIPKDRKCLKCSSPFSYVNPSTGWVQWFRWNGGFICSTCKHRMLAAENKMVLFQSTMEMADILPVGSNRMLGEIWP